MKTIEAVAIRCNGVLYSLPRPNRHWNVIGKIHAETGGGAIRKDWQGFLDNDGKFLGRREARKVAARAGQLNVVRPKTSPLDILFSEDVW